ncbi:MAG: Dabb family protein [Chthoniobacterales bacterium]
MVHHLVLFKLKPGTTDETVENMMRETRMQLLKIPEVLNIKCGKRVDPDNDWQFFLAVDFESMNRLAVYTKDPIHVKYVEEIIKPNVSKRLALDYEMEPGRDVKYS